MYQARNTSAFSPVGPLRWPENADGIITIEACLCSASWGMTTAGLEGGAGFTGGLGAAGGTAEAASPACGGTAEAASPACGGTAEAARVDDGADAADSVEETEDCARVEESFT